MRTRITRGRMGAVSLSLLAVRDYLLDIRCGSGVSASVCSGFHRTRPWCLRCDAGLCAAAGRGIGLGLGQGRAYLGLSNGPSVWEWTERWMAVKPDLKIELGKQGVFVTTINEIYN